MSSSSESDEALARRLQAEEFASLGIHPAQVADALRMSSGSVTPAFVHSPPQHPCAAPFSYPSGRFSSSSAQLQPSPQPSPLASPSSSPAFRPRGPRDEADAGHSALPLLTRPSTTVRQNAYSNLNSPSTGSHSKRVLFLYLAYALAELVTSSALLALYWNSSCNVPLNVWVLVHTARWALFLPLAVKARLRASPSSMGDTRMKQWGKYVVFVWWIVGVYWLCTADSCSADHGVLFKYSLVLVVLYGVRLALPLFFLFLLCLCLPCALLLISYLQPNPGASPESIRALPTRAWTAPPPPADGAPPGETPACAICMDEYKEGDLLRCLPCSHEFHVPCCDRWLQSSSTCPLCRSAISEEGREEQERERQREREQERLDREELARREEHPSADGEDDGGHHDDDRGHDPQQAPHLVDVV